MDHHPFIDVFRRMVQNHRCSVDDILEAPELRKEYLQRIRREVGDLPERQLLHTLTNLRRTKKLPRSRDLLMGNPTDLETGGHPCSN